METLHFNFTAALSSKNNNNKKKMEKFQYFAKCQKLKQLSKVPTTVQITKQHLKDILKGF